MLFALFLDESFDPGKQLQWYLVQFLVLFKQINFLYFVLFLRIDELFNRLNIPNRKPLISNTNNHPANANNLFQKVRGTQVAISDAAHGLE